LNITQWLQQQAIQDAADGCFDSEARHMEAAREIERLTAENADLLFAIRVKNGLRSARTNEERDACERAAEKARAM
jgi:hypothetical protein